MSQPHPKLRDNEEILRLFIEHTPAAVAMFDTEVRYLIASHRWLSDYGLGDQEIIGRSHYEIFPEIPERWKEIHRRCVAGAVEGCEADPFPRADGSLDWVRWQIYPWHDRAGEIGGIIMFTEVITARKQIEEELRVSHQQYERLANSLPVGVFRTDAAGKCLYVNRQWCDLAGMTFEAAMGDGWVEAIHPDDQPAVFAEWGRTAQANLPFKMEYRFRRPDGTITWLLGEATADLNDAGEVIGYIGTVTDIQERKQLVTDITERKQAEEILAKQTVELEAVAQVSTAISTILDPQELLQKVVDLTKRGFDLYHVHIYLLDEREENLTLAAGAGAVGEQMVGEGWNIPLTQEQSIVARAARARQGIIVNDVRADPDWLPNPLLPETRAEMAIPVIAGDTLLGVLDVQSAETNRFTPTDLRIKSTLAAQVAVALQNARLFETERQVIAETEEQARRLAMLSEMSAQLNLAADEEGAFKIAALHTPLIIPSEQVTLALLTPGGTEFEMLTLHGASGAEARLPVEGTALMLTLRERRVVRTSDAQGSELLDLRAWAGQGLRSVMSAPLLTTQETIGALVVAGKPPGCYTHRDENLLLQVASLLSAAVENRRLLRRAQTRARQEQLLREITTRVRSATDPDIIIRTAVRELSTALKRPTFVRLLRIEELDALESTPH
jgi:PAS domain S-box-containing protein